MLAEKNMYGFYSGGFLFDRADRIGHYFACKEIKKPFVFTKTGYIRYYKQACKEPNRHQVEVKKHWWKRKSIDVKVKLWDGDTLLCDVSLEFVGKNKNYCKKQGKDVDNVKNIL